MLNVCIYLFWLEFYMALLCCSISHKKEIDDVRSQYCTTQRMTFLAM